MTRALAVAVVLALASGCAETAPAEKTDLFAALPTGPALESATALGPVSAKLRLRPREPRLGDVVYLELEVTAPTAIDVNMPEFGEALGRFAIVDYDWRETRGADNIVRTQLYQLQAAASGRVRVPSLRVEIIDHRPDAPGGAEPRELLLDELAVDVAGIDLADGESVIRAGPGTIEIAPIRPWHLWWVWMIAGLVVLAGLAILALSMLGRARAAARVSAYALALERLSLLRSTGLPEADELDSWYVELSSIVRHYLEDRFAVRAPELTTEEFLREASQSSELSAAHRETLASFLAGCDRVKFAGHRPEAKEQTEAIEGAFRFVKDTRPTALAVGGAS